jgi:hypothetical protein
MTADALPLNRKERRQKVKVPRQVVDQASHYLGVFLTFITSMSHRATAQCSDQAQHAVIRRHFMQMFGEVATTLAGLDEAANPNAAAETEAKLAEIRGLPEYKEMLAMMQADRVVAAYAFDEGEPCESELHPGELAFRVKLKVPCKAFGGWLIGRICTIGSQRWAVMAVEYAPLEPPFKAGDEVRLVVRAVADDGQVADKPKGESDEATDSNPSDNSGDRSIAQEEGHGLELQSARPADAAGAEALDQDGPIDRAAAAADGSGEAVRA